MHFDVACKLKTLSMADYSNAAHFWMLILFIVNHILKDHMYTI